MKVALAQLNPLIGDVEANAEKMRRQIAAAADRGAELVVFSELSVLGYPPRDLLLDASVVSRNVAAVESLANHCRGVTAVVGFVRPAAEGPGPPLEDAAAVLADGKIQSVHVKSLLPNYDVYDDPCYFRAGTGPSVAGAGGERFGVAICEDLWDPVALGRDLYGVDPLGRLMGEGVGVIVNIAASGYQRGKVIQREELFARQARRAGATLVYVNQVGGNDDMIFDGGSCAVSATGELLGRAASFREDLLLVDTASGPARREPPADEMARLADALKLGLADYVRKCGFGGAVVALGGDLSSAVVAALAADALGTEAVRALALPHAGGASRDVRSLAKGLGLKLDVLGVGAARGELESLLGGQAGEGPAADRVAARVRGDVLTLRAAAEGRLALEAASKTDLALGRCVPAAGAGGALAPVGDLFDGDVLQLARHLHAAGARIPDQILAAGRQGDDSPPDEILRLYVERSRTAERIAAEGFDEQTVRDAIRRVDRAEHGRRQAPLVLKVTPRAFGPGRRMPVARAYI